MAFLIEYRQIMNRLCMTLWVSLVTIPAVAQNANSTYKAPRLTGTSQPNLNGLWQSLNEGNWDILAHAAQPGPPQFGALFAEPAGPGIVEGNEIPYQPWALAKKKENFEKRLVRVNTDGVRLEPLDPGGQVLSAGRAARHLHAVSIPDHSRKQQHRDRL